VDAAHQLTTSATAMALASSSEDASANSFDTSAKATRVNSATSSAATSWHAEQKAADACQQDSRALCLALTKEVLEGVTSKAVCVTMTKQALCAVASKVMTKQVLERVVSNAAATYDSHQVGK